MRISLVTPNYNHGAWLQDAICSVIGAAEGIGSVEHIVVDGASTDAETVRVLDRYRSTLARVIVEPDRGVYDAVNKGFAASTGEIMGWLNSTDTLLPRSLSIVAEIFSRFPQIEWLTSCVATILDPGGRIVRQETHRGFTAEDFFCGRHLPGNRNFRYSVNQESTFWRRPLWERAGGYVTQDFGPAGDFELWSRFFRHAELWCVSAPIGAFRRHECQLSTSYAADYLAHGRRAIAATVDRRRSYLREGLRRAVPNDYRWVGYKLGLFRPAPVRPLCFHQGDTWALYRD